MELLEEAYLSANAIDALERLLKRDPLRKNVDWLVGDSTDPDVEIYRQTRDDECSNVAWRSRFIYFATSLNHLSLTGKQFSFAGQKPCVWLDVSEQYEPYYIQLVKQGNMTKTALKVIVYVVLGKLQDMETLKTAVDLTSGRVMPCSRGSFVQISMTKEKVELVRPHPHLDCYVLLTREGVLQGLYHKDRKPLPIVLH